jgi:hypothetical protein
MKNLATLDLLALRGKRGVGSVPAVVFIPPSVAKVPEV